MSFSRTINYTWFVQGLRYILTRHGIVESNPHSTPLEANTLKISFLCTCYVDIVIVSRKYSFLLIVRKKNKQQASMGKSASKSCRCWSVARQKISHIIRRYTFFCGNLCFRPQELLYLLFAWNCSTLFIDHLFTCSNLFFVHMNNFIYCLHKHFRHYL